MAKIGRNTLCPCGSGLKYKKCCLQASEEAVAKPRPPRPCHWSLDEVNSMDTQEIIAHLHRFGIPFDREQFFKDVDKHYSCSDLTKTWKKRYTIKAQGFDRDFVWMAIDVLWARLVPEKMNLEQLDSLIIQGYEYLAERKSIAACDCWILVWNTLKERFTQDMKDIQQAENEIFPNRESLFNMCQDLELELRNAGLHNSEYFDYRIQYCTEFMEFFPRSDNLLAHGMKRAIAESYFMLGEIDQAEKLFQALVEEFPDTVWSYIGWGDMYADKDGRTELDVQRAKKIYQMALGRGIEEESLVVHRIEDLDLGR